MQQKEIDDRNNKMQAMFEQRKRELKMNENDGFRDYKKHLKELKQGYSEPRVPRRPAQKLDEKKQPATEDKKKPEKSPDLDNKSNLASRIIKREVKTHSNPEVIAMNHQQAVDQLNVVEEKVIKGQKNHKDHLSKIQEDKQLYSQKLARAKLLKEVTDVEKNQHIGRYALPGHYLD